ncbi:potassium channel family protein [Corynebacterium aquilae]|uniref:potassium channel family protein n=1 Tax=Corynebacterium aquilae TaxID=203263 RepID=UPI000A02528C|nr:potassium channel family protein [Corynebacterium aquilae]
MDSDRPSFRQRLAVYQPGSWWEATKKAYRQVFHRRVPQGASRQARWEARFEGPLLVISVVFLALFAWSSLADLGPWGQAITGLSFTLIWVVFAVDYVVRLVLADNRWRWFWRHIPEFLLVILPWFRPLQILRIVPTLLLLQRVSATNRNITVASYTIFGSVIMIFVAALMMYDVEAPDPDSMINSFGDALWWSIVTVTTVGYGDIAPVTAFGRLVGIALMVGGIALAGVLTATVSATLVRSVQGEDHEAERAAERAAEQSMQQALAELSAQNQHLSAQVAALNDKLEMLLTHSDPPGERAVDDDR